MLSWEVAGINLAVICDPLLAPPTTVSLHPKPDLYSHSRDPQDMPGKAH